MLRIGSFLRELERRRSMNPEENKAIVRRLIDALNRQDMEAAGDLLAPDIVAHTPWAKAGVEQEQVLSFGTAFPDMTITIEDELVDGDKVVTRQTVRGTHQGEGIGLPPTGKQATWEVVAIARIADGKIAETWTYPDTHGLVQQLGATPAFLQAVG
jgi:steroid delta-isomerase-like uncharacterized protein